jgi:hypothetical protein
VRNKIPRFRLYGETMQIAFRLRATGEGVVVVVDIRPIRQVTFRLRLKGERIVVVVVVALLALVTGIAMEI